MAHFQTSMFSRTRKVPDTNFSSLIKKFENVALIFVEEDI